MRLRDLAKKLGVSPSTVSRALNPATAHRISDPVRQRIEALARKNHYVPNRTAQHLVKGHSQTIGVILYSAFGSLFFDDYLARVQQGIYDVLGRHPAYSCKLVILPRGRSLSESDESLIGEGVDGILISTICDFTLERIQDLAQSVERRWNRPTVALNLIARPQSRISTVSFSNHQAAYRATTHLLQQGHKHIGLIYTQDGSTDVAERVRGHYAALTDHHLSPNANCSSIGDFTPASGYRATVELFKRKENARLTALFCTNDEMAMGAIKALRALRRPCPDSVAVMGFDGLAVGEYLTPRLSTVSQPILAIAQKGTELLLDLIEGRQTTPTHVTVESELLIRESA